MAQIQMYRQKLETAKFIINLAAFIAFIEAGLHIMLSVMEISGPLIIIPCINSGLLVLLALQMMTKKNTWVALILLVYCVLRLLLGMDLVPGYGELFVINQCSFAVMIFQIWGLYYTYKYNKLSRLISAAEWGENMRAYGQSNGTP